jgi:hypothetical protein
VYGQQEYTAFSELSLHLTQYGASHYVYIQRHQGWTAKHNSYLLFKFQIQLHVSTYVKPSQAMYTYIKSIVYTVSGILLKIEISFFTCSGCMYLLKYYDREYY